MIKLFENEFIAAAAAAAAAAAVAVTAEGEGGGGGQHTNLFLWPFIYGKNEGIEEEPPSPLSFFYTIAKVA